LTDEVRTSLPTRTSRPIKFLTSKTGPDLYGRGDSPGARTNPRPKTGEIRNPFPVHPGCTKTVLCNLVAQIWAAVPCAPRAPPPTMVAALTAARTAPKPSTR